jgi:mono/diheme cytochrome c family protein
MTRTSLLLAAALVPSGLAGCINEDLLNPMADRQGKVAAYSPSEFYDDQLAMRQPPAGTVPRERITANPAMTTGKVLAGRKENGSDTVWVNTFPLKVDRALLELGRKKYDITCGTCHGPVGDGDSIVARQMALRPPPSLIAYKDRPVGYIFDVATNGFGMMASYAAELSVKERWAVVAYIRALQLSQSASLDQAPPEERSRLEQEAR